MSALQYVKAERISLRVHPEFNEAWLQGVIAEDPSILGLGEVNVLQRERRQDRAGRLDLLLSDPDSGRRYEVEIMLGPTDESHIIRCIEYWDIERRRFPQYDHVAVLIAENVTSRFLNILGLFNGSIPMIAMQLSALKVGDKVVLDFVRVMDEFSLRSDDTSEPPPPPADLAYWKNRASASTVEIAETCVNVLNELAGAEQFVANFNRHYIGLRDGNRSTNFVHFGPKKRFTHILALAPESEPWVQRLEDTGLDATVRRDGYVVVTVNPAQMKQHYETISSLLQEALAKYQG